MQVKLANPRGFCAGVDRAIAMVDRALELFGAPIYVRHEVVHNKSVVADLSERGAVFVDELGEIPRTDPQGKPSVVLFSAHGVSKDIQEEAQALGFKVFDATCPLVTKVHVEVARHSEDSRECVLIGHASHPEIEGTMGQYDESRGGRIYLVESAAEVAKLQIENEHDLAYVTQTTLSVDDTAQIIKALKKRFPAIREPRRQDICYATQNRQDAVKQLALECDLVLVLGSVNSSNSNRLQELAKRMGCESHLIDGAEDIREQWLAGKTAIGVTAGASAPESAVREVVARLAQLGGGQPREMHGVEENYVFSMPKELRQH